MVIAVVKWRKTQRRCQGGQRCDDPDNRKLDGVCIDNGNQSFKTCYGLPTECSASISRSSDHRNSSYRESSTAKCGPGFNNEEESPSAHSKNGRNVRLASSSSYSNLVRVLLWFKHDLLSQDMIKDPAEPKNRLSPLNVLPSDKMDSVQHSGNLNSEPASQPPAVRPSLSPPDLGHPGEKESCDVSTSTEILSGEHAFTFHI